MQVPDLESLAKKDYFILYQQQKKVPLQSSAVLANLASSSAADQAKSKEASNVEENKMEDNEMVLDEDDDGDRLMEIAGSSSINHNFMDASRKLQDNDPSSATLKVQGDETKDKVAADGGRVGDQNLSAVIPREHLTKSVQQLHDGLMKYLELQVSSSGGTDVQQIEEHAQSV